MFNSAKFQIAKRSTPDKFINLSSRWKKACNQRIFHTKDHDNYRCRFPLPHVMTKYVFSLLVLGWILIRFTVTLLEFVEHFIHFNILKVFMHKLSHWIKVVPRLHLIKLFQAARFSLKRQWKIVANLNLVSIAFLVHIRFKSNLKLRFARKVCPICFWSRPVNKMVSQNCNQSHSKMILSQSSLGIISKTQKNTPLKYF